MKKNLGPVDSYIRTLISIAFIFNIFILPVDLAGVIVLLIPCAIFLGTASIGFCFIYKIINISTAREFPIKSRDSIFRKRI